MKEFAAIFLSFIILGCAKQTPIVRYDTSKSSFGNPPELAPHTGIPESEIFRVFHRAATGFVPLQSIREDAEKRATEYCDRQGKGMRMIGERTSSGPYILGNFPRIEICFACIEKSSIQKPSQEAPPKDLYTELTKLDDLRKKGLITDVEYEAEKKKLLARN